MSGFEETARYVLREIAADVVMLSDEIANGLYGAALDRVKVLIQALNVCEEELNRKLAGR